MFIFITTRLIILAINFKVNNFFNFFYELATKDLSVKVVAWQRPTLAERKPPSALRSLTSVFGMGTGVTSLPLSPDKRMIIHSKLDSSK